MSALDDIRQRAEAATGGPWAEDPESYIVNRGDDMICADLLTHYDAEFIAHARTDVPRLLGALDAVLALHKPVEVFEYDDMNGVFKLDADGEQILMATFCAGCTPDDALESIGDCEYDAGVFNGEVSWPCPTVAAVNDALEGK